MIDPNAAASANSERGPLTGIVITAVAAVVASMVGAVAVVSGSPRTSDPHEIVDAARWYRVWVDEMYSDETEYPLYGVNMFETTQENLERATTNIRYDQNVEAYQYGGTVVFHETYPHGENVRTILIIRWDDHVGGPKRYPDRKQVTTPQQFFGLLWEFFSLVEAYNWFTTKELADDPSTYLKLLDTNLH